MKTPLLCSLGFHKWRNCGNIVEVFWQEPTLIKAAGAKSGIDTNTEVRRSSLGAHSKAVHEGRECKRCGLKLRRKLVRNSDGTLSAIGWETDTEETDASA